MNEKYILKIKREKTDHKNMNTEQGCYKSIRILVSKHFGPRRLRTLDISAPSDWCRSVQTVRLQCRSVSRHWYQTVSTSSRDFCCNRPYRRKV